MFTRYNLCTTLKNNSTNYILYTTTFNAATAKILYYDKTNTITTGKDITLSYSGMFSNSSSNYGILSTTIYGNDGI